MRVLLATNRRAVRSRLLKALGSRPEVEIEPVASAAAAACDAEACDVAVIDAMLPDGTAATLIEELRARGTACSVVLVCPELSIDDTLVALRTGADDVLGERAGQAEILSAVDRAFQRGAPARAREERMQRLEALCAHLNYARAEVSQEVGGLCGDLVDAYRDLNDRVGQVSNASEFNSIVRQELDLEDLLRTALEYVLAKIGPTNAAIFLPSSDGDFSLGAYVNYDCPKDTCEVLLDQLANVMAPRFDHAVEPVALTTEGALEAALGAESDWLRDSGVVVVSCRHEDECLAVLTLFRDRRTPFDAKTVDLIGSLAELFGKQLARVIHVHHRHLPKDQWGMMDDEAGYDDDIDLAA